MDYTVLFDAQSLTATDSGLSVVEKRIYESGDFYAVWADGPFYNAAHDSIPGIYVQNINVVPVRNDRCMKTITYGVKTQDNKQNPNQYGETWEWTMMAHTKKTLFMPDINGNGAYGLIWQHYPQPTAEDAVGDGKVMRAEQQHGFGVGFDGKEYKGAEIYSPTGALKVSKSFEDCDEVNEEYRQKIYDMEGTLNDAVWMDWEIGTILFIGANIRCAWKANNTAKPTVTVDYNFIFGRNVLKLELALHSATYDPGMDTVDIGPVGPFSYVWQEPYVKNTLPAGLGSSPQGTLPGYLNIKMAVMYSESNFDDFGLQGPGI